MLKLPCKATNLDFSITGFYTAYEFRWDDSYIHLGEQHDFWEIVYVMSGEVEVAEDERVYRLHERNIIFHAPMEFHKIRSLPGSSPHILILTFSADGRLPSELREGVFNVALGEQDKLYSIVTSGIDIVRNEDVNPLDLKLTALELASFILRLTANQTAKSRFSPSRSAKEYHKVVVTMAEGIRKNLSLNDIADECNISISYIKTLFSRYSGISPKQYFTNMRFNEAVRLLEEGYSVNEVSDIMNFSSPNYFSVFFKNQCGTPPAKYIKNRNN